MSTTQIEKIKCQPLPSILILLIKSSSLVPLLLDVLLLLLVNIRDFKQSTTAGATTAAVTKMVWGEYVSVVYSILSLAKQDTRKHGLRSLNPLLFSFSQPNSFAQRTMAVVHLARTNRLFLSKSECHTLCMITTF